MDILQKMLIKSQEWIMGEGIKLIIAFFILVIGFKVISKMRKIFSSILTKKAVDQTIGSFLDAVIDVSLKVLLVLILMEYVGLKTSGIVALVGSAGLAVGLALQGSLSNFAGGVMILLVRPFNVGDLIDTASHSGVVERIGIFYTHLVTFDNKVILIPNGEIASKSITNYTTKDERRVDLNFAVGYECDVNHVKRAILSVIESNELIFKEPEPFVALSEHGDSAIVFTVRVWTKTEDYWKVHFDLLERVKIRFDEEGISIPYNKMDININSSTVEKSYQ